MQKLKRMFGFISHTYDIVSCFKTYKLILSTKYLGLSPIYRYFVTCTWTNIFLYRVWLCSLTVLSKLWNVLVLHAGMQVSKIAVKICSQPRYIGKIIRRLMSWCSNSKGTVLKVTKNYIYLNLMKILLGVYIIRDVLIHIFFCRK